MPKLYTTSFLSFFGTAHVTQKLYSFIFWKFHWVWHDHEGILRIIKKMTDFLKNFLRSKQREKCVEWSS